MRHILEAQATEVPQLLKEMQFYRRFLFLSSYRLTIRILSYMAEKYLRLIFTGLIDDLFVMYGSGCFSSGVSEKILSTLDEDGFLFGEIELDYLRVPVQYLIVLWVLPKL